MSSEGIAILINLNQYNKTIDPCGMCNKGNIIYSCNKVQELKRKKKIEIKRAAAAMSKAVLFKSTK